MSDLSNLLNPAPAENASPPRRKDSLPPLQIPGNPYATSHAIRDTDVPHYQDAANVLTNLSSANIDLPANLSRQHSSPLTHHQEQHNSQARRMSQYGDSHPSTARADLSGHSSSPSSQDRNQHLSHSPETLMTRKMSSPSLEQYHMSSRSPDHARRASMVPNPDLKLPPFHSPPPPAPETKERATEYAEKVQSMRPVDDSVEIHLQPGMKEQGKPIRAGSVNATGQSDIPAIKSEASATFKDPIPAFVPVASVKHEQTTETTPTRESPAPVPTTEDAKVATETERRGVKRPAPKAAKKGIAKKGPPAKKQKTNSTTDSIKTKPKPKKTLKQSLSASATPRDNGSPAPHSTSASVARSSASPAAFDMSEDEEPEDEDMGTPDPDDDVYCICRRPDTGTFMIGCDGKCQDWFHGKCVGVPEKDKNLIDRYICPNCEKAGVGVTTWKRMCRRVGCRMPARLAKKKDEESSKYCSDECGIGFFRDMMGRTRGAADVLSSGRKSNGRSKTSSDSDVKDTDLGPRGGVIKNSELKSLVTSVSSFEDFKKLGDGVLSPPDTPSPSATKTKLVEPEEPEQHLDELQAKRLAEIAQKKNDLRERYTLLRDQAKVINILRQTGIRTAESKGLKPRDVCGYDELVGLDEGTFAVWRSSAQGQAALKSGIIEAPKDGEGDTKMSAEASEQDKTTISASGPCMKKKCLRHHEWSKLALETNRAETSENSETMRALEREEKEIKERAGLKARQIKVGDVGGRVEHHSNEAGATNGAHDEDQLPATKSEDVKADRPKTNEAEKEVQPKDEPLSQAASNDIIMETRDGLEAATT